MKNCALSVVFVVTLTSLAAAADVYQKRASWAESMTATRRQAAQTVLRDIKLGVWHDTESLPAQALTDVLFPNDQPDLKTRDAQRRNVFRAQSHYQDGHVHGLGNEPKTVRYLFREIHFAEAGNAELKLGTDCPVKVWWNGEAVFTGAGSGVNDAQRETIRVNSRALTTRCWPRP